jgi:hypothetical protein
LGILGFFSGADGTRMSGSSDFSAGSDTDPQDGCDEADGSEGLSSGSLEGVTDESLQPAVLEQALAVALERASAAGEWGVVAALAAELAARRVQAR